MSTIAEIKEAISQLPEGKRQKIVTWVQGISPGRRRFTDDGLDIDEVKAKVAAARRGKYRHVDPEKQIRKIMASLK